MPRASARSFQDRFERTPLGRAVISAFLMLTLLAVLTANLPVSRLKELLNDALHYYVYGVGLDQSWAVFAPDPRSQTIHVTAEVTYEDGSKATWTVPKWDPVIGAYSDYRWLKWTEYAVDPAYNKVLGRPAALYVAREKSSRTRRPRSVSLENRSYQLQPPGAETSKGPVQERAFFTTQVTEEMLREDGE